jgi:tRNA(fMet)-specific endonuclease VapC
MTWLIDTNVLIHANRGKPRSVSRRLMAESPENVSISTLTIAELWYGIARHDHPASKRAAWLHVLEPYIVLPFDRAAAELHGDLRFHVRHAPIGERDLMIAAIALVNDLTVVTANVREFSRVPHLRVDDWSQSN